MGMLEKTLEDDVARRKTPKPLFEAPSLPGQELAHSDEEDEEDAKDHDGLDNEGMTDLYWEHVLEYEMTQLRKLFLAEMQKKQPEWVAIMRDNGLKADFEMAVRKCDSCDSGMEFKRIKRWIDALVLGDVRSLSAEFNE